MGMISAYIKYRLRAKSRHKVHSPFAYRFVNEVLLKKYGFRERELKDLRKRLLQDNTILQIEDHGAGSRKLKSNSRSVKQIARTSASSIADIKLLQRICHFSQCTRVIELGTNLGLATAGFAAVPGVSEVVSIEGDAKLHQLAQKNLSSIGVRAKLIHGRFDDVLHEALDDRQTFDLAFIDGNHQKSPTFRYMNAIMPHLSPKAVLVIGDIHWSDEMEEAWEEIKQKENFRFTFDIFHHGIVYLDKNLPKQDFTLKYGL